jgi:hypothetical protein
MTSYANLWKTSFENMTSTSKSIMTCKTPQDAWTAQANAMKSTTDFISSEVSRISALSSRVAQEAISPITENFNTSISKVTKLSRAA